MVRLYAVAVGLAAGLACGSETCESETCEDEGITLTVDHPTWDAGLWTMTLVADDATYDCTFSFPLGDVDKALCAAGKVVLTFDKDAQTLTSVFVEGLEIASLQVTFTFDGVVRHDETITPSYAPEYPNGPGCPPACYYADHTVTF